MFLSTYFMHLLIGDIIDITVYLGYDCHTSNFCERLMTLEGGSWQDPSRSFDLSHNKQRNTQKAWLAVGKRQFKGKRGTDVTLTIKRMYEYIFEAQEIQYIIELNLNVFYV